MQSIDGNKSAVKRSKKHSTSKRGCKGIAIPVEGLLGGHDVCPGGTKAVVFSCRVG